MSLHILPPQRIGSTCAHMTCHCMTRQSTTLHCTPLHCSIGHDTEVLEAKPRPRSWEEKERELGMFCRGDVMSRFVILEGLERSGTGASRRFFLVSFPDPAHVPDPRRPPGRTAASVPRSGRCASCLSTPQCPSLSVCLSVHKRISPKKQKRQPHRQASALPREGFHHVSTI